MIVGVCIMAQTTVIASLPLGRQGNSLKNKRSISEAIPVAQMMIPLFKLKYLLFSVQALNSLNSIVQ